MGAAVHTFKIKRTPWSVGRTLTIDPLYLDLEGALSNTRFSKDDIEGFRYGVHGFWYILIPISRTYHIEVRSSQGKILAIRMHSFLGLGNRKIERLFIDINQWVQIAYFRDMAKHYVQLLSNGMTYELSEVFLSREGVQLKKDRPVIPWISIGLTAYRRSCSVYDLSDALHHRSFDYWHDWNASLLYAIVDYKIRLSTYELLK